MPSPLGIIEVIHTMSIGVCISRRRGYLVLPSRRNQKQWNAWEEAQVK